MKDRTSKYPGRVRLTPVEGQPNVYDREWADEPQQPGTPLNKETLLSDAVAAALRLSQDDPTVSDALRAVAKHFARVIVESREPTSADDGEVGYLWINTAAASAFEFRILLCVANDGSGAQWAHLISVRRKMECVIIRESTTWTVPDTLDGEVHIMVYGGGGGGGAYGGTGSNHGGGGGGGGTMAVWTGTLTRGTSYLITIGAGGAGKINSQGAGSAGGTTSFGNLVSAVGGSAGSAYIGGSGGSGGGGGVYASYGNGGEGNQFGPGGAVNNSGGTISDPGAGVDTTGLDIPDIGKGTGAAGSNSIGNGGGGGGGYGGSGGNGGAGGGGGGGGYGVSGNGGDASAAGGIGAGGGGGRTNDTYRAGAGGNGICVITYYSIGGVLS